MNRKIATTLIIICFFSIFPVTAVSQNLIQSKDFTYIPSLDNKATLIREIQLNNVSEAAGNYTKLKKWIKNNFTTDLINSSIMYYSEDDAVLVKSKVDLLLPILNKENISEKALMTYHLYAFIRNGICVVQVTNIDYKLKNAIPNIRTKIRAEDFVTNEALQIKDGYTKEKIETQKGTLYFFNNLINDLEKTLNEQ